MTREETLRGIQALAGNEPVLKLIEAQQALSSVGCDFAQAMEEHYGEEQEEPRKAVDTIYAKIKEMDAVISDNLGELIYEHFCVPRMQEETKGTTPGQSKTKKYHLNTAKSSPSAGAR